ncbi:MAG: hypothetical protein OHK0046_22310 [Anaerolineae bacterium]
MTLHNLNHTQPIVARPTGRRHTRAISLTLAAAMLALAAFIGLFLNRTPPPPPMLSAIAQQATASPVPLFENETVFYRLPLTALSTNNITAFQSGDRVDVIVSALIWTDEAGVVTSITSPVDEQGQTQRREDTDPGFGSLPRLATVTTITGAIVFDVEDDALELNIPLEQAVRLEAMIKAGYPLTLALRPVDQVAVMTATPLFPVLPTLEPMMQQATAIIAQATMAQLTAVATQMTPPYAASPALCIATVLGNTSAALQANPSQDPFVVLNLQEGQRLTVINEYNQYYTPQGEVWFQARIDIDGTPYEGWVAVAWVTSDCPAIAFAQTQEAIRATNTISTATPSSTWTPTVTASATFTTTWTPTVTASATATATATSTTTPTTTWTPTMTATATPSFLCMVEVSAADGANVRSQPTIQSTRLALLPPGQQMEVTEQQSTVGAGDTNVWYRIRTEIDGIRVEGWLRADTVTAVGAPCPLLPGS